MRFGSKFHNKILFYLRGKESKIRIARIMRHPYEYLLITYIIFCKKAYIQKSAFKCMS